MSSVVSEFLCTNLYTSQSEGDKGSTYAGIPATWFDAILVMLAATLVNDDSVRIFCEDLFIHDLAGYVFLYCVVAMDSRYSNRCYFVFFIVWYHFLGLFFVHDDQGTDLRIIFFQNIHDYNID
jgi:hypothetical protein